MIKKVCATCKVEKYTTEFNKKKRGKFGVDSKCKECQKEYDKEYYQKNKESISEKNKEWREKNKESILEKVKEWRENNKEWYKEWHKEYREKNKEKRNEYEKQRKKTDLLFKLRCNISTLISMSLKRVGYKKNSKLNDILGCSYEGFKLHIESQFEPWMNWENHGRYNGELNYGWDLDHIYPISKGATEEERIKLNHYTNFQPLCSKVNRHIKSDKI